MTLHPRAAGASVIIERTEGDASGNNDRQRTEVVRMTIPEAEAMVAELRGVINAAKEAWVLEREVSLAKAEAEVDQVRLRLFQAQHLVGTLKADIAEFRSGKAVSGDKEITPETAPALSSEAVTTAEEITSEPCRCAGCRAGAEHLAALTAAAPTTPTPTESFARALGVVDRFIGAAEPEMPDFLRRTA